MLASGSWDRTVRVWNPRRGTLIFLLEGHTGWVKSLSFSRDGILLASAGENDMVRVWDMTKGTCLKSLQVFSIILQGLFHVVFSADTICAVMKWYFCKGKCAEYKNVCTKLKTQCES
ncbi:UNVERIFIED_CONTAM: hypothetical protein FKN15_072724 [Acipenser sinensis]